jgi:hypothetical protein
VLSADINWNGTKSTGDDFYREHNGDGYLYENSQLTDNQNNSLNAQVNFEQQLKKVKFEEGYRFYWQNSKNDSRINGTLNSSDYDDWRNYFYVNALGNIIPKIAYQAGAGFDMAKTLNSNTYLPDKKISNIFNELTPNAMLRYFITDGQNLTLDYNFTRQTPSSSAMDPTPIYTDSVRIITGNPDLKSYYINRARLSYEFYKSVLYFNLSLQHNRANNYVTQTESLDDNGIYHIGYTNASSYSSTTAALNFSITLFKIWRIMGYGAMNYYSYKDKNRLQLNKNFWVPSLFWLQNMVNYKKMSVNLFYMPYLRIATLTGYNSYGGETQLTANYMLNSSWSLNASVRYLFPIKLKSETYNGVFSEVYYNNKTERYMRVILGVRYSFRKGKQQDYRQKKSKQYDDNIDIETKKY